MNTKKFAVTHEDNIIINYEQLKDDIKERFDELVERVEEMGTDFEKRWYEKYKARRSRPTFLLPFKGEYDLMHRLHEYIEKYMSMNNNNSIKDDKNASEKS